MRLSSLPNRAVLTLCFEGHCQTGGCAGWLWIPLCPAASTWPFLWVTSMPTECGGIPSFHQIWLCHGTLEFRPHDQLVEEISLLCLFLDETKIRALMEFVQCRKLRIEPKKDSYLGLLAPNYMVSPWASDVAESFAKKNVLCPWLHLGVPGVIKPLWSSITSSVNLG